MKPSIVHRLRASCRELGVPVAVLYLLDYALRRLHFAMGITLYRFVAQPLAAHPRLSPNRGKAFSFQLIKAPEPLLDALGRPAEVIAQRFAQGAMCLAALKNERLVGCIWFVHGRYLEDEVRADYWLPADGRCVWDFDVFVADSERLGFLFAKLWDALDAHLRTQGVAWTLSRINGFNQRSLASHRGLGATDCGWALFLRLRSFEAMVSSVSPYLGAGFRRRQSFRLAPPTGCQ